MVQEKPLLDCEFMVAGRLGYQSLFLMELPNNAPWVTHLIPTKWVINVSVLIKLIFYTGRLMGLDQLPPPLYFDRFSMNDEINQDICYVMWRNVMTSLVNFSYLLSILNYEAFIMFTLNYKILQ